MVPLKVQALKTHNFEFPGTVIEISFSVLDNLIYSERYRL